MSKYRFTDEAVADLNGIIDYSLETWEREQTRKYTTELEQLCQKLAGNPRLGNPCNELADGLYSFPYHSHILFYCCSNHTVSIVRILHMRMNVTLYF